MNSKQILVWFMSQENEINGFPTIEMVNIISNYVIPNKELSGLYRVMQFLNTNY